MCPVTYCLQNSLRNNIIVALADPLFHFPSGVAELCGHKRVPRLISVIHIGHFFPLQNSWYFSVMKPNFVSMDVNGANAGKSDTARRTNEDPNQCFATPKWKICHKSKWKNSLFFWGLIGMPLMTTGIATQGATVSMVTSQHGLGDKSSKGKLGIPLASSPSWPPRHRWQIPKHLFLLLAPLGVCRKDLLNPPSLPRAGRSPFVHKCTSQSLWPSTSMPWVASSAASSAKIETNFSIASGLSVAACRNMVANKNCQLQLGDTKFSPTWFRFNGAKCFFFPRYFLFLSLWLHVAKTPKWLLSCRIFPHLNVKSKGSSCGDQCSQHWPCQRHHAHHWQTHSDAKILVGLFSFCSRNLPRIVV